MVPVHYRRRDISFPHLRTTRPSGAPSLDTLLNQLRNQTHEENPQNENELKAAESFIGRDGLLLALEVAARSQHVVVLHGPGGTGKTELAKAFGRWWRDTGGVDRPEFVVWHSFEPGLASFGLDGLVTSLGLRIFGADFAALDADERRRTVEGFLAGYRVLWLWDNFETVHSMPDPTGATPPLNDVQADELRGFLHRIAAHSRSTIVITSRSPEDWLGPQVRRIEVGGLSREEAVLYTDQLLAPYPGTRGKRQQRVFEELVQWLDGHPLSMRLTLPQLDSTTPERLLNALQGIEPLPVRDEGDRTTSLAASVAYSFAHLPDRDRQAITALALFHTTTDSDVLGMLSRSPAAPQRFRGLSAGDWESVLERASQVGLLSGLGSGVYRLHPALPSYLTAYWRRLASDGFAAEHAAAMRALLDAYAAFAHWLDQQWRSQNARMTVALVEAHRRNLSSMLGHALDHRHWQHANAIARTLDDYWNLRGLAQEARGWVDRAQQALENPPGTPPPLDTPAGNLWAFLTHSQANRHHTAGRLDQAEDTYRTLLHAYQQLPDSDHQRTNTATFYHQLGITAQARGDLDQAEHWYRQTLTIREDLNNRPGMATSYGQLGLLAEDRGEPRQALAWTIRCIALFEAFPHPATGTSNASPANSEPTPCALSGTPPPDTPCPRTSKPTPLTTKTSDVLRTRMSTELPLQHGYRGSEHKQTTENTVGTMIVQP